MKIQPEFDGHMWSYEGARARTVRELLKLLPPRTRIADYYPNGYSHRVEIRKPHIDRKPHDLPEPVRYTRAWNRKPEPAPPPCIQGKWTPETIRLAFKLKDQGITGEEIGKRLGFSRGAVIGKLDRERRKLERPIQEPSSGGDVGPDRDVVNGPGSS